MTVLSTSVSSVVNDITICDGDSVLVGSSIYTSTGSYIDILTNSAGCDSIITTNITPRARIPMMFGEKLVWSKALIRAWTCYAISKK